MESWIMDARYAARRLVRRPLYALLSVLTLALGIGGTAAVYGIARPILLDRLPYAAEEELGGVLDAVRLDGAGVPLPARQVSGLRRRSRRTHATTCTLDRGERPGQAPPGHCHVRRAVLRARRHARVRPRVPARRRCDGRRAGGGASATASGRSSAAIASIIGQRLRSTARRARSSASCRAASGSRIRAMRIWIPQPLNPEEPRRATTRSSVVSRRASRSIAWPGHIAQFVRMLDERFDYPAQWDKTKSPVADAAPDVSRRLADARRSSRRSSRWGSSCSSPAPTSPR